MLGGSDFSSYLCPQIAKYLRFVEPTKTLLRMVT